jgi:hypothetical protein
MVPPSPPAPSSAVSMALLAVEWSENEMLPLEVSGNGKPDPPAAVSWALAAVELLKKLVAPPTSFIIVCVLPELLTMPAPTKEKEFPDVFIEKALEPGLNVMESMVTSLERDSEVVVERLNVAVSPAWTGAIGGVQLSPSFQEEDDGFAFQTASTASAAAGIETNS